MRLSPYTGSRADVDEMFSRFFGDTMGPARSTGHDVPTDIVHTEGELVIRMDLPGVDPDKVDVSVQENVLLINGHRPFPFDADKVRFVKRGAFYGDFTQRIALGKGLDLEKIKARYDSGVLVLSVPYAEEVQPKKISIEFSGEKRSLGE